MYLQLFIWYINRRINETLRSSVDKHYDKKRKGRKQYKWINIVIEKKILLFKRLKITFKNPASIIVL